MRTPALVFLACLGLLFVAPLEADAQWKLCGDPGGGWIMSLAMKGEILFAATQKEGVFLSTDNGTTWTAVGPDLPSDAFISYLTVKADHIFVFTTKYGVFSSSDDGATWAKVGSGLPALTDITCITVGGKNLFACNWRGLYISVDNGANWATVYTGLEHPNMRCVWTDGTNIFVGTEAPEWQKGSPPAISSLLLSTDGGASWKDTHVHFPDTVNCLAMIGTNLFAGTDRGIYLWEYAESSKAVKLKLSAECSASSFVVMENNLIIDTGWGRVFLLRKVGKRWKAVDLEWPEKANLHCLMISGENLFAGTFKGGVWRTALSDIINKGSK